MSNTESLTPYDTEPVIYCSKCYSLKICHEDSVGTDCCMECGCSDVVSASIEEWEKLYEKRYGKRYVTKNTDPRSNPIFKLSLGELKMRVFNHPQWEKILHTIYPHFPKGLSKTDSIILFFDKLVKDNRLNGLRLLLLKYIKEKRNGRAEGKTPQDGSNQK